MTQNIRKYKSFIFIALVGVLFYFFVTLFKYAMGPDERAYFSLGLYLRETGGYYSPKHHPLYSILMSLSSLLGLSALGVTKIVFIFSGMILWISIYWLFINIGYDKVRYKLFQAIFVGTLPGTSSLILYSGSSLVYTAIITASIALTLFAYKKDLNILYFL